MHDMDVVSRSVCWSFCYCWAVCCPDAVIRSATKSSAAPGTSTGRAIGDSVRKTPELRFITDRSYGIHVAQMAGLPGSVIKRSEGVLYELERHGSATSSNQPTTAQQPGEPDQMLLFSEAPPLPEWWSQLVDALAEVDVDRTTPLEALKTLQQLKDILQK